MIYAREMPLKGNRESKACQEQHFTIVQQQNIMNRYSEQRTKHGRMTRDKMTIKEKGETWRADS